MSIIFVHATSMMLARFLFEVSLTVTIVLITLSLVKRTKQIDILLSPSLTFLSNHELLHDLIHMRNLLQHSIHEPIQTLDFSYVIMGIYFFYSLVENSSSWRHGGYQGTNLALIPTNVAKGF